MERLILVDSVGFSGSFPLGQYLDASLLDWGADWLRWRKDMAFQATAMLPFIGSSQTDKFYVPCCIKRCPAGSERLCLSLKVVAMAT